ncbi:AAA domain-containing protein [Citrus sinensis]|uniref:AAA domain-containing protein n=1 Tax=Citrus sinensis TaxID=2711 RepID=A0ACB8IYN2_CITSI|nr:AAA domain-containing protein [Citrus sinensis]
MAAGAGKCFLVTGPPLKLKIMHAGSGQNNSNNEGVGKPQSIKSQFKGSGFLHCPESYRWPTVGRYKVDVASFEAIALPELQVRADTDLFVIDEVGKMELFSSSFFPAVLRILESNIPVLASIPAPKPGRDIPAVARLRNHPGATIFTLSPGNRDSLKDNIYYQLTDAVSKH